MHSIIVPFLNQEPLFTAEQVMEELEAMMQDSLDLEASLSSEDRRGSGYEERLGAMRVAELNELLQETESHIQAFSEELVQELARREELDFEKEVKNGFIALLIDVQNRQKELRETLRRRKKLKNPQSQPEKTRGARFSMEGFTSVFQYGFRQTFGSGCSETQQYLTTLIPYEKRVGPPSIEDLQVLTNILQAMKENSDKVPSLLTDYILKVLCPT
ncbi:fasciculation and elongation protein zeta-2-like [Gadus chalcogrammus]|uniref:fasciculation and elongation protein zeta-2-like n=1 Tax=Gadus chalcogrammus TaxID=1042646 RepID=UPI0024C23CDA|nr:fasciculation and elongation protein zeta-2-like [Gadus chalcogrammus]